MCLLQFHPVAEGTQAPKGAGGLLSERPQRHEFYYQTFIPDDQSSFGYSIFDDSDELGLNTSDELETGDEEQEQVSDISLD